MNARDERRRALGHHRPHFGGDSASHSDTTSNQFDQRASSGTGGLSNSGAGASFNISSTDHGAVLAGTDLARAATALAFLSADQSASHVHAIASDAVSAVGSAYGGALAQLNSAYETAKAGDQREVSMVAMAAVAIVVAVAVPALFRKKG